MLLAKEFGVPIREMSLPRQRIVKQGVFGLDSRGPGAGSGSERNRHIYFAPGADFWARLNGSEEMGPFSHESEHDLALMVSDFLENGSSGTESRCSSDSDNGLSDLAQHADKISLYKRSMDQQETDLLSVVHSLLLSIEECDLHTVKEGYCNFSCVRHSLVKLLKSSGYDASVCVSKWQTLDKVPGGDHEYIDVIFSGNANDRVIIDIDFRSHFEIARAVDSYDTLLNSLPVVYVGTLPRLKQFLQVMVDAAKYSLKLNSMPLPPWRSLAYLQAKWYSKHVRKEARYEQEVGGSGENHGQCAGHLRKLKLYVQSEIEKERMLKPLINDKKWRVKFERRRGSVIGYK
ncbi:DUF506 family protein (DUF506) [Rhynchospora pubera]|uniref:DUF506 family protein (DUF506) n=1 Tax=Rhynchospora pubera TaxID=906938 RepID=A0AAV8F651_9POAL|nr:DUF506 family protein (DUF506) [Rhynchospora pubera]